MSIRIARSAHSPLPHASATAAGFSALPDAPRLMAATAAAPLTVPRAQLQVPYTPVGPQDQLDDTFVFDWPDDAHRFYIPEYQIAADAVGTAGGDGLEQRYRMTLERDGQDWLFSIHFAQSPAEAIRLLPDAGRLQPLNRKDYPVTLGYTVETPQGPLRKRVEFQSVDLEPSGLRAVLRLSNLADQRELYAALTERDGKAELTVARQLTVGVPVEVPNPEAAALHDELRRLEGLQGVYLRRLGDDTGYLTADGRNFQARGAALLVENLSGHDVILSGDAIRLRVGDEAFSGVDGGPMRRAKLVDPAPPDQRILIRKVKYFSSSSDEGGNDKWVQGAIQPQDFFRISFYQLRGDSYYAQTQWGFAFEAVPANDPVWAHKGQLIADQKRRIAALGRKFDSNQYRVVDLNLSSRPAPDPLFLKFHKYVFKVPRPDDDAQPTGLIQHTLDGTSYYQDAGRPQRFYYLPDRFELDLQPNGMPCITIQATTDGNRFIVAYVARPFVDQARLLGDQERLLPAANALLSAPAGTLEYEPLVGERLSFSVNVPSGQEWKPRERPGAIADLHEKLTDAVTLTADELRLFYDALFARAQLFSGVITGRLGDWASDRVPFSGHVAGDPATVWSAIFDPTVPALFARTVRVVIADSALTNAEAISVTFENGGLVTFTRGGALSASTEVRQPIGDFVLGRADSGTYRYTLTYWRGSEHTTTESRTGRDAELRLS